MKTAIIIIRTGELFFCKHLHNIGAIYNCCMFKSQVGRVNIMLLSWGEVREQILVTKGVTGHSIQPPPPNYINTMFTIVKLALACD